MKNHGYKDTCKILFTAEDAEVRRGKLNNYGLKLVVIATRNHWSAKHAKTEIFYRRGTQRKNLCVLCGP